MDLYANLDSAFNLALICDLVNLQATLRGLCDDLEIPFQPSMLRYAEYSLWKSWPCAATFFLVFLLKIFLDSRDLVIENVAEAFFQNLNSFLDSYMRSDNSNFELFSWEAGPKQIDGLWAPWWYNTVHKSTGFKEQKKYPKVCSSFIYAFSLVPVARSLGHYTICSNNQYLKVFQLRYKVLATDKNI